jgi:hypothetical protein
VDARTRLFFVFRTYSSIPFNERNRSLIISNQPSADFFTFRYGRPP